MGLFKKKSDPISERARALNAEIAALESQIQKLNSRIEGGGEIEEVSSVATNTVTAADNEPQQTAEIVFEKIDQRPLRTEPVVSDAHYNEAGMQKFDLPALLRRLTGFVRSKPPSNPKLVNYLAAGSVQGLRPLRFEKRVARNRFIALATFLVLLMWGIFAWILRHH